MTKSVTIIQRDGVISQVIASEGVHVHVLETHHEALDERFQESDVFMLHVNTPAFKSNKMVGRVPGEYIQDDAAADAVLKEIEDVEAAKLQNTLEKVAEVMEEYNKLGGTKLVDWSILPKLRSLFVQAIDLHGSENVSSVVHATQYDMDLLVMKSELYLEWFQQPSPKAHFNNWLKDYPFANIDFTVDDLKVNEEEFYSLGSYYLEWAGLKQLGQTDLSFGLWHCSMIYGVTPTNKQEEDE